MVKLLLLLSVIAIVVSKFATASAHALASSEAVFAEPAFSLAVFAYATASFLAFSALSQEVFAFPAYFSAFC